MRDVIVKAMVDRIKAGLLMVEQVPEAYRAEVEALLNG